MNAGCIRLYYAEVKKKWFASCHHPLRSIWSYFIRKHAIHHPKWLWMRSESLKLFNGMWEMREIVSDYRDFPLISSQVSHIHTERHSLFCRDARDSFEWIFHLILECSVEIASSFTFLLISFDFYSVFKRFFVAEWLECLKGWNGIYF